MPTQNDKKTITAYVITAVALAMCAFHLYTAQFGLFSAMVQRPVHLLFACTLVLLIFPIKRLWSENTYPLGLRIFDWVLIAAVAVAIVVMMIAAQPIADFVEAHPSTKMLALAFLVMVGMALMADGLHFHVERGFIYAAMVFAGAVEALNLLRSRRRKAAKIRAGE